MNPAGNLSIAVGDVLSGFAFLYPLLMAYLWMGGALFLWAYTMGFLIAMWALGHFGVPTLVAVPTMLPRWTGVVIGTTCLLQVGIGIWLDSRVEKGLFRYYFSMIWYPLAFWLISVATTLVGVPRAILRTTGRRARWKSPDRGLVPEDR